ncbi:NnrS family protein [uncultured Tateyamaria sp.]|uniref:NnrS family protein n=1 Tax=uncultured Tateyamaria sp. TaxID=455651 RepID=UPI00261140B8|nr:NnrS family protein [uncultured Tateyamaria sp.]
MTLLLWVLLPLHALTGFSLLGVALLHAIRLWRWRGIETGSEPLVWVLNLAYLLLPLGAFLEGLSIIRPDLLGTGPALHVWMVGALGLMTLVVMTRATLGHTGQSLVAGAGTKALFWMVIGSTLSRVLAGF